MTNTDILTKIQRKLKDTFDKVWENNKHKKNIECPVGYKECIMVKIKFKGKKED